MSIDFQNWITILSLGIIGGSLIGLVMGHKLKDPMTRAISSPMIFQNGNTNKVLASIGLILIGLAFFNGVLQGICAIAIGYITEMIVGTKISNNHNKAGYGTVIKTIIGMALVIVLPVTLWGYASYNRTPSSTDKASFIYECNEYLANDVFKSGDNRNTAKAVCGCLWPDLMGRYKSIGMINDKARDNGKVSIGDSDVNAMAKTCLSDYHNSN